MGMTKKGQTEAAYIILALALVLVGTLFYYNFKVDASSQTTIEKCRLSVLQNSAYRSGAVIKHTTGINIPTPEVSAIDCPKMVLNISRKLVDRYTSPDYGAKYEIASAMKTCKYEWGDFQLRPFSVDWFETGKRFCSICYGVSFSDDFPEKGQKLTNFMQFLSANRPQGSAQTFAQYLTNTNNTWDIPSSVGSMSTDQIDTNKDYVVMYTIDKKGTLLSSVLGVVGGVGGIAAGCTIGSFLPIVGTAIGCGLGFIAGGTAGYVVGTGTLHEDQAVWFVPLDSVRDRGCDILYQY